MSTNVIIEAKSLYKEYNSLVAVDGIDFQINQGECFGFLGPNGAGKTTTMRMLYLASPRTKGELNILGHQLSNTLDESALKEKIGVVPQEDNLDQDLSTYENLEVFCRFYGLYGKKAKERCDYLLGFVDLKEKANAKVMQLSGGMKRRLLIARGLIGNPELVVMDEPTTGLDPQARHLLWERIRELKRNNATVVLTTHYMDEAEQLCDRLVIMDHGKIVEQGRPRDLIKKHIPGHVVEIRTEHLETLPNLFAQFKNKVARAELLSDRILFYTENGQDFLNQIALQSQDHQTYLRQATLEDVFLKITGRRLEE